MKINQEFTVNQIKISYLTLTKYSSSNMHTQHAGIYPDLKGGP